MPTMKQWAVGEEVLAADFNTYLQNQVVPVFASAAIRDSEWPAPPTGALCVTANVQQVRAGTQWLAYHARLGLATRTTSGTNTAAESIVLTLSNIVVPAGRMLRVCAGWRVSTGTSGEGIQFRLREGTTVAGVQVADMVNNMASAGVQVGSASGGGIEYRYTNTSAGTKAWILTTQSISANPVQVLATTNSPIWLAVYDEGNV